MTSEEMQSSVTRKKSNQLDSARNENRHSQSPGIKTKLRITALDDSFSSSEGAAPCIEMKNSPGEVSFMFEDENSPENGALQLQPQQNGSQSPGLPPAPALAATNRQCDKLLQSPEEAKLHFSPLPLANEAQTCAAKPIGMRRVKRFQNLEQRSGRMSSSRGTSPNGTSSSQTSDVYHFLQGSLPLKQDLFESALHAREKNNLMEDAYQNIGLLAKTRSSNFDDSLGIESLQSDKLSGVNHGLQLKNRRALRQPFGLLFKPPQGGRLAGGFTSASIFSPSSAQQHPHSLTNMLKAALAEQQDFDVASGREFQYSEDFSRPECGATTDRENFPSILSPINNSNNTRIVLAEGGLDEEAYSCSDIDDEITEETYQDATDSGTLKQQFKNIIPSVNKKDNPEQIVKEDKPSTTIQNDFGGAAGALLQQLPYHQQDTESPEKQMADNLSSQYSGGESYSFDIWPYQGADSYLFDAQDFCDCQQEVAAELSKVLDCGQCGKQPAPVHSRRKSDSKRVLEASKFKLASVNSNNVPKHRLKNMFTLNNYISESEGFAVARNSFDERYLELHPKNCAKSNVFNLQAKQCQKAWDQKTNANMSRRRFCGSTHLSIARHQSSFQKQVINNQSMGWIGELSSMVLGKLISGGDRCASDSASAEIIKLDHVDSAYKPTEQAVIDQLYESVEPCDLISKQQTTMIYLAKTTSDTPVVLKTIDKEKIACSDLAQTFAQRESAVHAQMDHPNIVRALHYSQTDKLYCIYMEYAGYGSDYLSRRVLGKNKPVKDEKMVIWAQDILTGIWYLHQRGVIHTDIKVDNILIFEQESQETGQQDVEECPIAKICDFGLCHLIDQSKQMAYMGLCVGTQDYQAPEMADKTWITPAVDMWAYGIVLYEMAVGYKPKKIRHLNLPQLVDGIPYFKKNWVQKDPHLIDLIRRCLQQDPVERITAQEALQHPYFTQDMSEVEQD